MKKALIITAALLAAGAAHAAPPLKQMPIDFVGEWCNGETFEGETNWKLPSWVDEEEGGGKCTNILSVDKYEFRMVIDKKSLDCMPDTIRLKSDTAPSGTAYMATINARCMTLKDGVPESQTWKPTAFEFRRYKGNIYIKPKK
ncbi:hypothetical protein M2222_001372 [Bradyrhizobium elkanii]|uniref:hypothetical protein n=1 Tax=Bradyrhizobium elkanii TaxID=29448 RepID=UPI00216737DB|nr:hypothetical protein [Bradyrhizobium elkanii]MCS3449807.1 hypothetical protein [Bradyrhizobium elkanii]MCS3559050.1 hypothetical protein [Bradyrhizobium elkanii]MCW2151104.1 hypothetical protein [Bradyrhizobium elkanii]MCW2374835.1 hypothetical protein [Bradyrhizobium elkanii]